MYHYDYYSNQIESNQERTIQVSRLLRCTIICERRRMGIFFCSTRTHLVKNDLVRERLLAIDTHWLPLSGRRSGRRWIDQLAAQRYHRLILAAHGNGRLANWMISVAHRAACANNWLHWCRWLLLFHHLVGLLAGHYWSASRRPSEGPVSLGIQFCNSSHLPVRLLPDASRRRCSAC